MRNSFEIQIPKLNKVIHVPCESNLMQELLKHEIPVASSCNGEGICYKCKIKILEGAENLSTPTKTEQTLFANQKMSSGQGLENNQRLSCQVRVNGPIVVDASYW